MFVLKTCSHLNQVCFLLADISLELGGTLKINNSEEKRPHIVMGGERMSGS